MPEVMLPAIVAAVCSERGRSELAGARGEHGANYAGIDGLSAWKVVVRVPRLRQLVVRFSDRGLSEIQTAAELAGLALSAWAGDSRVRRSRCDGRHGFAQLALLRTLVATLAAGPVGDDDAVRALSLS